MVSISKVRLRDLSYTNCKVIARFECLTTPPRNKNGSQFSNMTTRSFEKEQKAGSRYTVEWLKNAEETHADMLDGWRPVPCTYLLNGVDGAICLLCK